jgi:hypothetical protein
MTRNLQNRIRKLENKVNTQRFSIPREGLDEIGMVIAETLTEMAEAQFAQNENKDFAVLLAPDVQRRAKEIAPEHSQHFSDEMIEPLCKRLLAESCGGTVIFLDFMEAAL